MFNDTFFKNTLSLDTTRIRQPKKDKMNRINQTQSVDLNNDDLNVSLVCKEMEIFGEFWVGGLKLSLFET